MLQLFKMDVQEYSYNVHVAYMKSQQGLQLFNLKHKY